MEVLIYIISLVIVMTVVIVVGKQMVKPIIFLKNKWMIFVILLISGFVWAGVIDIFQKPLLAGIGFGIVAGVIQVVVDEKAE